MNEDLTPQKRKRLPRTRIGRVLLFGVIGGVVGFGVSLVYSAMGST